MRDKQHNALSSVRSKQADLTEGERRVEIINAWRWRAWAEHAVTLSLEQSKVTTYALHSWVTTDNSSLVYISDSYSKELIDVCGGMLPRIHHDTIHTCIEHLMIHYEYIQLLQNSNKTSSKTMIKERSNP